MPRQHVTHISPFPTTQRSEGHFITDQPAEHKTAEGQRISWCIVLIMSCTYILLYCSLSVILKEDKCCRLEWRDTKVEKVPVLELTNFFSSRSSRPIKWRGRHSAPGGGMVLLDTQRNIPF